VNSTAPSLLVAAAVTLIRPAPQESLAEDPPVLPDMRPGEKVVQESTFDRPQFIVVTGARDAQRFDPLGLLQSSNALVHVLASDAGVVAGLREKIRRAGVYGRVSASRLRGTTLPHTDAIVNRLLVLEGSGLDAREMERVLAPGGTALVWDDGDLKRYRKERSADTDEWSHARYDATGNAVSRDARAGPPNYLQWEALPRWNRGTKTSCLVSAGGRIFYILDDAPFSSSVASWSLTARDAYNGIRLWRQALPRWPGAQGGKKVGPAQVNRRLVALGDRVCVTLGGGAPVSVLDAATGKVLRILKGTANAEEFIVSNGVLVAVVDPASREGRSRGARRKDLRLVAVAVDDGALLWQRKEDLILPLSVAADGKQVVYHEGRALRSLDLRTGVPRWDSPATGQKISHRGSANPDSPGAEKGWIWLAPQFAPTLLMYKGVVAFAGGRQINVVSADDGSELWRSDFAASNYSVPVDMFGFGGYLWGPDVGMDLWRPTNDDIGFNAYDPLTGEISKRVRGSYNYRFQHHRCHQMKMVGHKVIAGRAGVEFLDLHSGDTAAHHWLRGSCYYGVLPANGLLYVPPHNCACYVRAKLSGFMGVRTTVPSRSVEIPDAERLVQGPAYTLPNPQSVSRDPHSEDWPTYRHDPSRSGRAVTKVDTDLLLGWTSDLGGRLTSPVVANDRVYVASTDAHELHALDAATGKHLWRYVFGARVDSPPTVHGSMVLCGCRDGSVHALMAEDGALIWRFLAAPRERLIVSRGQLESVWPVSGSVLVMDPSTGSGQATVYVSAGKSSYLDGGIHLYGLDLKTGRPRFHEVLYSRDAAGAERLDAEGVDGFLNDILSSDGRRVFMRHRALDLDGKPLGDKVTHLHGADGYLSSETTSRLLWTYAPGYTSPHQGAFYDRRLSRVLFPTGRLLVQGDDAIYGFGENHYGDLRTDAGGAEALFAAPRTNNTPLGLSAREYLKRARSGKALIDFRWWTPVRIRAWAMVNTEGALFVAGPPRNRPISGATLEGREAAGLLAVSPDDGEVLADMILPAAPTWDGIAAARGNLFVTLKNGQVACLWPSSTGRPGKRLSPPKPEPLPPVEVAAEPGLVGRWRFNEGQGRLARDCSGKGHDARVSGQWGKDDAGTHLVAAGVPHAAVIPDAPHLRFGTNSFALAFWVKADSHDVRLVGKEAFPREWWVVNLLPDGHPELVIGEGTEAGKNVRVPTTVPLPRNTWTHLVVCVDRSAGQITWFINGKLDRRRGIPLSMNGGVNVVGCDISIPSKHKPLRGALRDVRIYRRALNAERVQELFRP
jgi:outer membrane protein assembly factor BamB